MSPFSTCFCILHRTFLHVDFWVPRVWLKEGCASLLANSRDLGNSAGLASCHETYETCVNTCEYYITLGLHSSSYSRQWSLVLYFDAEERCTSGLQVLGLCTMSCSLKLLLLLLSGHFGKNNARTNVLQNIAESILVNLCSRPPVVSAPCSTSKLVHNLQRHAKTRALLGHFCVKSTCYALPTLGTIG